MFVDERKIYEYIPVIVQKHVVARVKFFKAVSVFSFLVVA